MFNTLFNSQRPAIDLIIPGLLNLPLYELDEAELRRQTPSLHQILRFADRQQSSLFDIDDILSNRLGLKQKVLPYAYACKPNAKGHCILFKPVHLKADINNAIVYPIDEKEDNLINLIKHLKDYFKVDFDIDALSDNSYLMELYRIKPLLEVPHYLSATGKKVTHYLEQAKANLDWYKLFNEIQMFLHQHDINQQRQQQGLPMINSLWCWGADKWAQEKLNNCHWYSDDIEMQAIGELYCQHSEKLSQIKVNPKDNIIVDLSLLNALKGHDLQPVNELLQNIENSYLKHLVDAGSHTIQVHTASTINFRYQSNMRHRFWKKRCGLSNLST